MNQYGYPGTAEPGVGAGDYGALTFLIAQQLAKINTMTLTQVVAVTNAGELAPVGFVDVQPLVNQVNGAGDATPHGVVFNVPYLRIQGGANAIIMDPQVGDIGACGFSSRDISAVKASKAQANPGSGRVFAMADGLYFGGFLGAVPTQYIRFAGDGIEVVSPTKIRFSAPDIELDAANSISSTAPTITAEASTSITQDAPTVTTNAPTIGLNGAVTQTGGSGGGSVQMAGPLNVAGAIHSDDDVTAQSVSLHGHTHAGVQPGGGETDPPTL